MALTASAGQHFLPALDFNTYAVRTFMANLLNP